MKMNYQKPEVSYICFETEAVMLGDLSVDGLNIKWGVTTSATGYNIVD